jgi:hypothetical protein
MVAKRSHREAEELGSAATSRANHVLLSGETSSLTVLELLLQSQQGPKDRAKL